MMLRRTMLSTATRPTILCSRLNARAAAARTSSSSSQRASLTAMKKFNRLFRGECVSVGCLEVFRGVNKVFRGVLIGCLPDGGKEDV